MRFVLPVVLGLLAAPAMAQQATEKQQLDALQAQALNAVSNLRQTIDDRDTTNAALRQQAETLKDNLASMTKDRDSVKASNDTLTKQVADLQAKMDAEIKTEKK
jgi:septal ring factor EnvC (AmiA/AmiB activator)